MEIIKSTQEMADWAQRQSQAGISLGLVATMGYLHDGHLSLVRRARQENQRVVVSIFVNPTQFGVGEDFEEYPRDFSGDLALLKRQGLCDAVFMPEVSDIYPGYPNFSAVVSQENFSENLQAMMACLCGLSRPGHFQGVIEVVYRLFDIVKPQKAYFGKKDYQQFLIIRQLVRDFALPLDVIGCETVRAADGLALSSRNNYLSEGQRLLAPRLYAALCDVSSAYEAGERQVTVLERGLQERLVGDFSLDYAEIRDAITLARVDKVQGAVVAAVAVGIGGVRLIDNLIFGGQFPSQFPD